ncbi:unnamed protein product [Diamesa tonsa]
MENSNFLLDDVYIKVEPDDIIMPSPPEAIQPRIITQAEKPRISIRTSIFEAPNSENQNQRTIKRSQSTTQREAESIVRNYRDRESNSAMLSEQSNASKRPRFENQTQNRNNRPDYSSSSDEHIRRVNYQSSNSSQNVTPPVRTNDPRLQRYADNGNSSIYNNPTPSVPLLPIPQRMQTNMDAVLKRCTKALDLIRNLKHSEAIPIVLYKFSELKPQQQSSERAKKSPLILNAKNVEYMLQASKDSSTECQIALLSRQFKNISLPLQSTMRVLGADINIISVGVAKAEWKRQKEEKRNESMGVVYLSDKKFRIIGTQTDHENFEDKAPPKTFENKGLSCNILVPNAEKSVQTVTNTDGFHFSIESLLLLTPAQRTGLQDFKKLMNMSDDGKIASIRERQQHRKVNTIIYSEDEELSRYMNPPPAPRLSASKYAMSFGPPR